MNKSEPKIVIYMPCYNHEKYVGAAIDSIIAQTYENWELYIVNDGSTDQSGEIISSYNDPRIHFYDFKKNTKYIGASNFLQDICRNVDADYIAVLASDDMWKNNKLEKQVEILCSFPEYKACLTWDKVIFSGSEKGFYENYEEYSHKKNRNRYEWFNYLFWNGNCFNCCSMLVDKQVFYELDRININYIQLGDFRLWIKLVEKYPLYLLEEELTYYRRHETNLSEPTPEVVIRNSNEGYQITKEIIIPMDINVFRRSFYMHLPYVNCDSEEALLAEKFILLVNGSNVEKKQVAVDIYFANCNNKKFISILENNYYFFAQDFFDLTGKPGIQIKIPASQYSNKLFTPAFILINAIDEKKLGMDNLHLYQYSTLFDLWNLTRKYEGGIQQFKNIMQYIVDIRNNMRLLKSEYVELFIIAQHSSWDFSKMFQMKQSNGIKCYVAFIPTRAEAMNNIYDQNLQVDGAEILHLYDEKEHALRFLRELSMGDVDCIYYVDCLDSEYECVDMAAGYSLAVEYRGILSKESYQKLNLNDDKIISMLTDIQIY